MEVSMGSNIPEKFTVDGVEYQKSVTKDGMYRWKDEHGNTGYVSEEEVERLL